jgi:hypothetical protein
VDGADAAAGGADHAAAGGKADLAGLVGGGETGPGGVDEGEQLVVAAMSQGSAHPAGISPDQPLAERRRARAGSGAP